ncbi:olfactory receptor 14A16-like [Tenrec ecaudatus]|uniref:olfactory receptor 14A16-like n=1 Tax=Tenrec ecaudatus TaxID=94439 RepID=UPI003F5A770B
MEFSEVWWQQILTGMVFLLFFLVSIIGNFLIIVLSTVDQHLQTPMYFFLKQLSLLDLCYISVTLPNAILDNWTHNSTISLGGCILQVFLVIFLACTEMALLTVMSYDHYVAICYPLHYEVVMNRCTCIKMASYTWFSGWISGILHTATTFSLSFRPSNIVHQFFCEIPQLLRLSCSDNYLAEVGAVAVTSALSLVCFISIALSYIHIFSTVLKMPSSGSQSKAFSTCIPHLLVVTFFLSAAAVAYLKPSANIPTVSDLLVSVLYTIVPPTVNPIIYSLRNKDMKYALQKYLNLKYFRSVTC